MSAGTKIIFWLGSVLMSAIVDSVLKLNAVGSFPSICAAFARFSAALISPSDLMIVALLSLSASACFAITLFIVSGSSISCIFTSMTSMPQGSVALSTIFLMSSATCSLFDSIVSRSAFPTASLSAALANCETPVI